MKIRKNIFSIAFPLVAAGVLAFATGCGDSLLDNLDSNQEVISGASVAQTVDQAAGMFLTAQQKMHDIGTTGGPHQYQYQFNLHIDNYSGYLCLPHNFDGRQPSAYAYFPDFAGGPLGSFFRVSTQALPVVRGAKDLGVAELGAMASIIYCYSALELSDVYGPFPWWDYKNDKQDPPMTYYPMKDIYDSIFVDLKKAVEILENFPNTSEEHQSIINNILTTKDKICGGEIENWIGFGNSIRLRMAIRMSNVEPSRAEQEARDAIAAGVLKTNVQYDETLEGLIHPIAFIATKWGDTRLNASFENLLKRLNSPMLAVWFDKNSAAIKNSQGDILVEENSDYIGVRAGIDTSPRDNSNRYMSYSTPTSKFSMHPIALFKLSEVYFLKAEAKLRWNIGSEVLSYLYQQGIKQSFVDEGFGKTSSEYTQYYNQSEADIEVDYVDPLNSYNNAEGLVTIGVKWNNSDPKEVQLEKIITQKYIANYPQGLEAWNDLRRTGYPRIFPVDDIGDGSLSPGGKMIRRIIWDQRDASTAEDILSSGLDALGGGNYQRTRLWWDTGNTAGNNGL
ncbi:SusD/RagB family nutrient-binding outer membrane lipoprotein [Coprobacter fastidiosus]|nr:SusD/RagB family nutrient-binding outer membrane lipoprotein [Coprobacter fastidiosus]